MSADPNAAHVAGDEQLHEEAVPGSRVVPEDELREMRESSQQVQSTLAGLVFRGPSAPSKEGSKLRVVFAAGGDAALARLCVAWVRTLHDDSLRAAAVVLSSGDGLGDAVNEEAVREALAELPEVAERFEAVRLSTEESYEGTKAVFSLHGDEAKVKAELAQDRAVHFHSKLVEEDQDAASAVAAAKDFVEGLPELLSLL